MGPITKLQIKQNQQEQEGEIDIFTFIMENLDIPLSKTDRSRMKAVIMQKQTIL